MLQCTTKCLICRPSFNETARKTRPRGKDTEMAKTSEKTANFIENVEFPSFDASKATDQIRAFAEKGVEQSKEAYAKLKTGADEAQKALEASFETAKAVSSDLSLKTISALRANAEADFAYLEALVGAKKHFRRRRAADGLPAQARRDGRRAGQGLPGDRHQGCRGISRSRSRRSSRRPSRNSRSPDTFSRSEIPEGQFLLPPPFGATAGTSSRRLVKEKAGTSSRRPFSLPGRQRLACPARRSPAALCGGPVLK